MLKKASVFVFFVSSILLFEVNSYAASSPLFGPKKYDRTTGAPNVYTDGFEVCSIGASYSLVVENGEAGANRVSSASITLNGTEVVAEKDFNQKVGRIERPVALNAENRIDLRLASGPGGFVKVSMVCAANCPGIKITSPVAGTTITNQKTLVKGALLNANGEVGVALSSMVTGANAGEASALAQVYGGGFAGSVSLALGSNTITATITDACGLKADDSITVDVVPGAFVEASALPNSGIPAPTGAFTTTLKADARIPAAVADYSWDTDGDGTIDASGKELSSVAASYTRTGLYFPKVTVTDAAGNKYVDVAVVNVLSMTEVDALLKTKWDGMKGGLAAGNVDKATRYFLTQSQVRYKGVFTVLKNDLPQIADEMNATELIYLKNGIAKYRIRKAEAAGDMTYYIYFGQDENGIWKIKQF